VAVVVGVGAPDVVEVSISYFDRVATWNFRADAFFLSKDITIKRSRESNKDKER
jgi:hypothetical protein